MKSLNWSKQLDEPLFPDLLWSRPETKSGSGKLLIIGGQAQEFRQVAEAYAAAEQAGAGTIRVIMPESTRSLTKLLPNIEYAPTNPSGSFARQALTELLQAAQWADAVLLPGDFGKNSETSLMLDQFTRDYAELLVISSDALSSITRPTDELMSRQNTTLVLSFSDLQKIGTSQQWQPPLTSGSPSSEIVQHLLEITNSGTVSLVLQQANLIWIASQSQVSQTTAKKSINFSQISAHSAVWQMQNPSKYYEALTTAVFCI